MNYEETNRPKPLKGMCNYLRLLIKLIIFNSQTTLEVPFPDKTGHSRGFRGSITFVSFYF